MEVLSACSFGDFAVQVTWMSRQVKSHVARSVRPSEQGITASALPTPSIPVLDDPTQRDDEPVEPTDSAGVLRRRSETIADRTESLDKQNDSTAATLPSVRHRTKPVPKSVDRTLMISQPAASSVNPQVANLPAATVAKSTWTQLQQKQLESALNQVAKGASDRWDRIAELVPDKTKVFLVTFYHLLYLV